MFPGMDSVMLEDFVELVVRNQHHVKEIIAQDRHPMDLDHRESVICFGRGFDWLHVPNKALIIGPFGNDLSASIITAGNLILGNIKAGRVDPSKGVVVMTAGLFYTEGRNKHRIMLKSYELYSYAKKLLEENVPELFKISNVQYLVGLTSHDTREFTEIDVTEFFNRFDSGFKLTENEKQSIAIESSVEA
jgi:hypothetical protein